MHGLTLFVVVMYADFVYGVGLTRYVYYHHGSTYQTYIKLIKVVKPSGN